MARLLEKYQSEVVPHLRSEFDLANPMEVPHITKVTCNIGVGEASRNAKLIDTAAEQLANVTGQKPGGRASRSRLSSCGRGRRSASR